MHRWEDDIEVHRKEVVGCEIWGPHGVDFEDLPPKCW
jgi:hypothetical protein